ncbi:zinc-finger homeodomain protein 11-like [Gastrolobium bilobum]|uniref:zinc-finger homeodomain protein 11-like n=1 Tax=Gastrolobium bilobum TaxID=150636 RepID=UPI002AB2E882|nr:zinc-finger homeodomain protein 11-like [Gastrolobium bilobum]
MDFTPNSTIQTLDTDSQTPPPTKSSNTGSKSSSFTNGSLKRHHHPTTTAPPPPKPPSTVVFYKECLKNHAASLGGHALDGCGEFMPSSSSNPTEPRSLTCAACGCHRNFHRRDTQEYSNNHPNFISFYHSTPPPSAAAPPLLPPLSYRGLSLSTSPSLSPSPSPMSSPSPPPLSHHFPPSYHHHHHHTSALLSLGNAYYSDEHHHHHQHHHRSLNSSVAAKAENQSGKKRHRTKFSQEQKEKMHKFSDKLGWRILKGDEVLVQEFCNDIGVSRGVFKVWMHNNKNSFKKRLSEMDNAMPTNAPPDDEKINGDLNGNVVGEINGFHSDINNPYNKTNSGNNDIHLN